MSWPTRHRHHLVAVVVVALLSAALVGAAGRASNARADEAEWITAGYRTYELVRDLAPPAAWETAYFPLGLDDWGNKNPPLGKLIIGLAVATARTDGERVRFVSSSWPFDYEANLAAGNVPPMRLLTAARIAIALFGAACLALAYVCCVQVVRRRWLPLLAPVALYAMLAFEHHSTHVFTDVPQVALMLGAVVLIHAHLTSLRAWSLYLALVLIGLSCAVKFSTGPVVASTLVAVGVLSHGALRSRLGRAVAVLVIPFAVFVAVNPYLYPSPVGRTLGLVEKWSASKAAQQKASMREVEDRAVRSRARGISLVATRGLLAPQLASSIGRATGGHEGALGALVGLGLLVVAAIRGRGRARGRRLVVLASATVAVAVAGLLAGPAVLIPILTGAGLVHLGARARRGAGDERAVAVVRHYLVVVGVLVVVTALWLPFDWSRYYVPLLVLVPTIFVAGVSELLDLAGFDRCGRGQRR